MYGEHTATTVAVDLLKKYDRSGPRYTSYPTVPIWSDTTGPSDYATALRNASARTSSPLALYCHIPFCRQRCYYCGCNTVITNSKPRVDSYIATMIREIENVANLLGQRRTISQLHFGGGTPTFIDTVGLDQILQALEQRFTFPSRCERSMEIDPRVTTLKQIDFLAACGFNRLSLGVQDFDPAVQQAVGRIQSETDIARILDRCRSLHFSGVNFDLIYGLPLQTLDGFRKTIEKTIAMRPDRIAVYSFAYLPAQMAHQSKIRPKDLPSTELKYSLFATAIEKFTAAGYRQIGMDHFALPEDELSVAQNDGRLFRNFMGYTVQAAPEMVGLGMSAIGYVDDAFFQNHHKLDSYQNAVTDQDFAIFRGLKLTDDDLIRQHVITQLMCNFRLRYSELSAKFGVHYHDYFKEEHAGLSELFGDDLLREVAGGLEITPVGRTFVRNIAMVYDTYFTKNRSGKQPTFSRTI